MKWRKCYLDVILVPLSLVVTLGYHIHLWHKVRTQPLTTTIGINATGRRLWVYAVIKDDKKSMETIQTLRNTIMGATLMATTTILLCSGLAAVISSTYSVKKPINDTVYGAHGEIMVALKYLIILLFFIFAFLCYTLSIRVIIQVNFLINWPQNPKTNTFNPIYVADLFEKGFVLYTVGNRLFYAALPLLLWIFGPVPVFLCTVTIVPVHYYLDFAFQYEKQKADAFGIGGNESA